MWAGPHLPSGGPRGQSVLCFFQLLGVVGIPWCLLVCDSITPVSASSSPCVISSSVSNISVFHLQGPLPLDLGPLQIIQNPLLISLNYICKDPSPKKILGIRTGGYLWPRDGEGRVSSFNPLQAESRRVTRTIKAELGPWRESENRPHIGLHYTC